MSEYIPDHILSNVLVRVPIDSLIRFRCVSRSWCDLIDSSYFKDMHSRRSCSPAQKTLQSYKKIIALVGNQLYTFDDYVVMNGSKWYTAIAKKLSSPNMDSLDYRLESCIMESCNGILCLSNYRTGDFVLWNPFTGSTLYSQQLTSPPYKFKMEYCGFMHNGFGHDHFNDDYKLVRWRFNGFEKLSEVCVYSFKHKSWRTVKVADALDLDTWTGFLPRCCTFANCAMHWLMERHPMSRNRDCENNYILAFDIGTCKFQKIPCAPIPRGSYNLDMHLSSLNGCLCLRYTSSRGSYGADIWSMKEYGVKSSWTKIACIDLHSNRGIQFRFMKVVDYSEEKGKLMLQCEYMNLAIYDVKTETLKDVVLKSLKGVVVKACVCVGGFVSPFALASIDN